MNCEPNVVLPSTTLVERTWVRSVIEDLVVFLNYSIRIIFIDELSKSYKKCKEARNLASNALADTAGSSPTHRNWSSVKACQFGNWQRNSMREYVSQSEAIVVQRILRVRLRDIHLCNEPLTRVLDMRWFKCRSKLMVVISRCSERISLLHVVAAREPNCREITNT